MDLISEFITRYTKEYDFYEQSCRIVSQILDSNLQSAGIRVIVTSRAKNPARLETKVRQRAKKAEYKSIEDIYNDIVDLAGVRVALYFPGEIGEVGKIIQSLFLPVEDKKEFPNKNKFAALPQQIYKKRFSGYYATHYRIRIPESRLNESQKRYSEARIEIQVASVLMHAWSEVEHDLVYKPLQGILSEEEYAILDELNGLVISGEIALERLQRAGELRASTNGREFSNHYDLAASLFEIGRDYLSAVNLDDAAMGRVDLLYQLLIKTELNTPDQITKYLKALHSDFEKRPLAEQVIDQILSEDPSRYSVFEQIRLFDISATLSFGDLVRDQQNQAIGKFIALWIEYERYIRSVAESVGVSSLHVPPVRLVSSVKGVSKEVIASADRLRRFRNQLVHGIEVPDAETIEDATSELRSLLNALLESQVPSSPIKGSNKRKARKKQ